MFIFLYLEDFMATLTFDTHAFVKELTQPGCRKNKPKCWRDLKRR